MDCPSCGLTKQAELTSEMIIHFRGREHLDNPGLLLFPKIEVCLGCGFSRFIVPKTELARLQNARSKTKCA
jgi:hypothetical protein